MSCPVGVPPANKPDTASHFSFVRGFLPDLLLLLTRVTACGSCRDVEEARHRLASHRCRMLARGVAAEPIGPGFCPGDQL